MTRRKSNISAFVLLVLVVLPLSADERQSFVFRGKQIFIGMSMSEAVQVLSDCCRLSPPIQKKTEENALAARSVHNIREKGESEVIIGSIEFANQQVVRLTKLFAEDVEFDASSKDLVAFIGRLKRVLQSDAGDVGRTATIAVMKAKFGNGEIDRVLITFDNGRGIEIRIGTFDKPNESNLRDFAVASETLELRQ